MKRKLRFSAVLLIVLFGSLSVFAQNPNWTPVPGLLNTMTVIGEYDSDPGIGVSISLDTNDVIAAFVGSQVRGVASPTLPAGVFYLNIGSNSSSGETITYKVYDASLDQVFDLDPDNPAAETFVSNALIGSAGNPVTFNILVYHTITSSANANGTITPNGATQVLSGNNQAFVITAATGYEITSVLVNGAPAVGFTPPQDNHTHTFLNVSANHTIHATFTIKSYTITYAVTPANSGTIPLAQATQIVQHGSNGAAVTVTPNVGFFFQAWDDLSTNNPRTDLNVTSAFTRTATLVPSTYSLTYTAGVGGTVNAAPQVVQNNVAHGTNGTTVTAAADMDYEFYGWSDGVTTAARTDLNVTDTIDVVAYFVPDGWIPTQVFGHTMTVLGKVVIDNAISDDPNVFVRASVGGVTRGLAQVMPDNDNLLFLTIGSNVPTGETVLLEIWKSAETPPNDICDVAPEINFVSNTQLGTINSPHLIQCAVPIVIPMNAAGFTWFSVNLELGSTLVNNYFADANFDIPANLSENDRIIGQNNFAIRTAGGSWVGSLTNVDFKKSYRMRLNGLGAVNFDVSGSPVNITPINLGAGYTWLGYLPQVSNPINTALSFTNSPATNDRLIGQTSFAIYNGSSWIGTLNTLAPGKGYVIQLASANVLNYPAPIFNMVMNNQPEEVQVSPTGLYSQNNYLYTMNVLANLKVNENEVSINQNDVVYAYINGEVRGMAAPIAEHDGLIFLSIGSNDATADVITFKVWIDAMQQLYPINATLNFQDLALVGDVENPFPIVLGATGINNQSLTIGQPYPNPFNNETMIPFTLSKAGQVQLEVYNNIGQLVKSISESKNSAGSHNITLNRENLQSGMYFYVIRVDNNQQTGTLIIK